MDREYINEKLKPIIDSPNLCGFEVYLVTRSEPRLKRLRLSRDSLHNALKMDIIKTLRETYLADGAKYSGAENVADNQNIFYIIEQTNTYCPLRISDWNAEEFKEENLYDFMGILFEFRYEETKVWCYQNKRSITVTNRKSTNRLAKIVNGETGTIFEEQKEQIVNFLHVVDILIIDDYIITGEVGLLERSFDFQSFIRIKAKQAADNVASSGLFSGIDKINDYLTSEAKSHKTYRKKMLKVFDSPVLQMSPSDLFTKLQTVPRWKGKFKNPVDGRIPIVTNKEVESMIDLLLERFTISQITGQEYDTEVKKKAEDSEAIGEVTTS